MLCTYIFSLCHQDQEDLEDLQGTYQYAKFTRGDMGNGCWEAQFYNREDEAPEDGVVLASLEGAILINESDLIPSLEVVTHPAFPQDDDMVSVEELSGVNFSSSVDSPYTSSENFIFLPGGCVGGVNTAHDSAFTCKTTHIRPLYRKEGSRYKLTLTDTGEPSGYVMVTVGYTVSLGAEEEDAHESIASRILESYAVSQERWKPFVRKQQEVVMRATPHHHLFSDEGLAYGALYKEIEYTEGYANTELVCNDFLYCGQEQEFMDNLQGFLPVYDMPWFFNMPASAIERLGDRAIAGKYPTLSVASFTIIPNKSEAEKWSELINSWMDKYGKLSLSGDSWYKVQ